MIFAWRIWLWTCAVANVALSCGLQLILNLGVDLPLYRALFQTQHCHLSLLRSQDTPRPQIHQHRPQFHQHQPQNGYTYSKHTTGFHSFGKYKRERDAVLVECLPAVTRIKSSLFGNSSAINSCPFIEIEEPSTVSWQVLESPRASWAVYYFYSAPHTPFSRRHPPRPRFMPLQRSVLYPLHLPHLHHRQTDLLTRPLAPRTRLQLPTLSTKRLSTPGLNPRPRATSIPLSTIKTPSSSGGAQAIRKMIPRSRSTVGFVMLLPILLPATRCSWEGILI